MAGGIHIRHDERAFFLGKTGVGKTTLAKSLMWGLERIIILDPKRTFSLPPQWPHGWQVHETLTGLESATLDDDPDDNGRVPSDMTHIYRPDPDDLDGPDGTEEFFRLVFERGRGFLFVDEAAEVVKPQTIGRYYSRCLRLGRERGLGTWSATQQPVYIPRVIFTQSEHHFIFRLADEDDRIRAAKFTSRETLAKPPRGHGFYHFYEPSGRLRYYSRADVGHVLSR